MLKVAILAAFIEALVTSIKWVRNQDKTVSVWNIVALGLGIGITPLTGLDLFAAAGIPLAVPFVGPSGSVIGGFIGMIFTGMIVCRGSNVLFDLYKAIDNMKSALGQQLKQ